MQVTGRGRGETDAYRIRGHLPRVPKGRSRTDSPSAPCSSHRVPVSLTIALRETETMATDEPTEAPGVVSRRAAMRTATKTLGCFGGAGSNDQFITPLGADGWWHFYFQGCGATESVALADPAGPPVANTYQPPTGYKCKMQLISSATVVLDTGYVANPINGIADTGGYVFIGTGAYPNGYGNMSWRSTTDPSNLCASRWASSPVR